MSAEEFKADGQTLHRYLQQPGLGFYIPIYQRGYSWGKENITRLFEDLVYGIERYAAEGAAMTFLGTFIVVSDKYSIPLQPAVPTDVFQVIDGQQRLTTAIALAIELSSMLNSRAQNGDEDLMSLALQTSRRLLGLTYIEMYSGEPPYNFWPRLIRYPDTWGYSESKASYQSPIGKYILEKVVMKNHRYISPDDSLRVAVEAIVEELKKVEEGNTESLDFNSSEIWSESKHLASLLELKSANSPGSIHAPLARLTALGRFLLDEVQLIHVRAPNDDYAFALFEPLNTTGQSLTPLETLKPLVVQAEGGPTTYPNSLSASSYGLVEPTVDDTEPSRKATKTADLLTAFALAETGDKLGRRLDEQRKYLRTQYVRREGLVEKRHFLTSLANVAEFEREVWRSSNPTKLSPKQDDVVVCLKMLRDSNHTIARGLLARYYSVWGEDSGATFCRAVRGAAAFWVIWRLSRSTTAGIDSHYRTLMAKGWEVENTRIPPFCRYPETDHPEPLPGVDKLLISYRNILKEKGEIDSRTTWIDKVSSIGVYATNSITKFALLAAHHDVIADPNAPGLIRPGTVGSNETLTSRHWDSDFSIEHVAPANKRLNDESYEQEIYDNGLQNRLGNLTLVPRSENSSLSNRPWIEKRFMYRVLGETDPELRLGLLSQAKLNLDPKTESILSESRNQPFCEALGKCEEDEWLAQSIRDRSRIIAGFVWDRLTPWLNW